MSRRSTKNTPYTTVSRMKCAQNSQAIREVWRLAKQRNNYKDPALAKILGLSAAWVHVGVVCGRAPRLPVWLKLCRIAGLTDAQAAVIWARETIPEDFAHLRRFIGCTVRSKKLNRVKQYAVETARSKADVKLLELLKQHMPIAEPVNVGHTTAPKPPELDERAASKSWGHVIIRDSNFASLYEGQNYCRYCKSHGKYIMRSESNNNRRSMGVIRKPIQKFSVRLCHDHALKAAARYSIELPE